MSTPNISASGNAKPQSTMNISFEHSKTYKFLPISLSPPRGIIRTGAVRFWGGRLRAGFFTVIGAVAVDLEEVAAAELAERVERAGLAETAALLVFLWLDVISPHFSFL
jgi:hypothetical protein